MTSLEFYRLQKFLESDPNFRKACTVVPIGWDADPFYNRNYFLKTRDIIKNDNCTTIVLFRCCARIVGFSI